jgi:hypothetical protein
MIVPHGLFPGPVIKTVSKDKHYLADCDQCGSLHPYEFLGDCREDANRYGDEQDYAERNDASVFDIVVLPTHETIAA